jgi:TRAP-type C4-dicarboxylate transport system permease small subunit
LPGGLHGSPGSELPEELVKSINRALTTLENVLAAGTLAAATLIAIAAVILRSGFGVFLFWSEEAIIYLIIFSTFFGAVITLRHQEHVNVDVIAAFLGPRGKRVMALIAIALTLVYLGAVGYFAWLLLFEPFSSSTTTPAIGIPLWVVESAVAIGFTLMFVRGLELAVRIWLHGVEEENVLETEAEAIGLAVDDLNVLRGDDPDGVEGNGKGNGKGRTDS